MASWSSKSYKKAGGAMELSNLVSALRFGVIIGLFSSSNDSLVICYAI